MKTIFHGIAIGIANIIPGVSGGTIAVILGIYDKLIEAISEFVPNKSNRKTYIKFLFQIGLGMGIGVLAFAKFISYCLQTHPQPTAFFFMGLIIGGIPIVYKAHANMKPTPKKVGFFIFALILILLLAVFPESKEAISNTRPTFTAGLALFVFISGFIAAGTMVIPGISGSFMLLLLGSYGLIINKVASFETGVFSLKGIITCNEGFSSWFQNNPNIINFLKEDILILSLVALGAITGIIVFTRLIHICLKYRPVYTYYTILGLIVGSLVKIFPGISFNLTALISLCCLIIGFFIAKKLS
jgi:putative membrane protein